VERGGVGSFYGVEIEQKGGALAWLAVDVDGAIMAGDYAVNDRKAASSALAYGFGGEEGSEDAVEGGAVHAAEGHSHGTSRRQVSSY
jgi:hypothetical protein